MDERHGTIRYTHDRKTREWQHKYHAKQDASNRLKEIEYFNSNNKE
jgi:hypothetical protein